ncbi:hypothetical protein XENORESO_021972, partial [Xenotaenia resolanae]
MEKIRNFDYKCYGKKEDFSLGTQSSYSRNFSDENIHQENSNERKTYLIGGIEVCRFLMGLCKVTLSLIIKHFGENGARPRLRKKSPQPRDPHFICSEQLYGDLEFLKNSAVDHTIMLPGRHPGHRDWH